MIKLTFFPTDADDNSDHLQRALQMNLDSDELSANFGDLGRLDDSMLRLLTEGVTMDQQIADPLTEEHLKS